VTTTEEIEMLAEYAEAAELNRALAEEHMEAFIEKAVNLVRLINEGGIYICGECPHYDPDALENCDLGFAAPSDCPWVMEAVVEAVRLLEA